MVATVCRGEHYCYYILFCMPEKEKEIIAGGVGGGRGERRGEGRGERLKIR